MWQELSRCTSAVLKNWLELAGGGLIAVVGWWIWPFICKQLGRPEWVDAVPSSLIWGLIVVALLLAFFKAWRSEYRKAQAAEARLKELSLPALKAQILQVAISDQVQGNEDQAVWFILLVSVSNVGAPSICKHYGLEVTTLDGNAFHPASVFLARDTNLRAQDTEIRLSKEDYLPQKTATNPIVNGAEEHGFVAFRLSTVAKSVVCQTGTTLSLSCEDIRGTVITCSRQVTPPDAPGLYPGFNYRL